MFTYDGNIFYYLHMSRAKIVDRVPNLLDFIQFQVIDIGNMSEFIAEPTDTKQAVGHIFRKYV